MLSVIKCMTILVASGNGIRCNDLKEVLRNHLLTRDEETGEMKVLVHKFGRYDFKEDHERICREVGSIIFPIMKGINKHFYCSDLPASFKA